MKGVDNDPTSKLPSSISPAGYWNILLKYDLKHLLYLILFCVIVVKDIDSARTQYGLVKWQTCKLFEIPVERKMILLITSWWLQLPIVQYLLEG